MTSRRRILLVAVVVVLLAAAAWYRFGGRRAPAGQPPVTTLTAQSLPAFKAEFNAAADQMRLVLLLSPT